MNWYGHMLARYYYDMKVENFNAKVFGRPEFPRMPYIGSPKSVFNHYNQIIEDIVEREKYFAIVKCKSCGSTHAVSTDDFRWQPVPDIVFGERYEIFIPCRFCGSGNVEFSNGTWDDLDKSMIKNIIECTKHNVVECNRCGLVGISQTEHINDKVTYRKCPWCGSIDTKLCNKEGS